MTDVIQSTQSQLGDLLDGIWAELSDTLEVDARQDMNPVCDPDKYSTRVSLTKFIQSVQEDYQSIQGHHAITSGIVRQTLIALSPQQLRAVRKRYEAITEVRSGKHVYVDVTVPVFLTLQQVTV